MPSASLTPLELAAIIAIESQQMGITIPDADFIQMVSIPSRESSYNPFAHNPNTATGDDSYGLYQINMLGSLGPSRAKALGITDYKQLYDPWINVKAMLQLYQGAGNKMTAWGGYKGQANDYNVSQGAKDAAAGAVQQMRQAMATSATIAAPDLSRMAPDYQSQTGVALTVGANQAGYPSGAAIAGGTTGPGDVPALADGGTTSMGGVYANPDVTRAPATPEEVDQYIKDNYGYMAGYTSDPVIGPILQQAAREKLSKDMLYGRLTNTTWWKTHSDNQRKWEQIEKEDPATATAQMAAKRATLANQVGKLGMTMSAQVLDGIVRESLSQGWTTDQETDMLLTYATPTEQQGYTQGDLAATQQQIQQLQSQYMIIRQNGFKDVADMAKRVVSGELTMDGVKANFANQAKSMFAGNDSMTQAIDNGMSPYDAVTNQRNAMANILEVSPDQIDMVNNPQYRKAIDQVDPKTGAHRIMTVSEAEQLARDQPDYKNTVGGRRAFTQSSDAIAQYAGIK